MVPPQARPRPTAALCAIVALLCAACTSAVEPAVGGAEGTPSPPAQLTVGSDGRSFATVDGAPFFWLGDTAWSLFVNLDREESLRYLDDRAEKGFTVIQAVAVDPPSGGLGPNRQGDAPYADSIDEPTVTEGSDPDDDEQYDYWDHIDFFIAEAAERGMYVALLPAWSRSTADESLTADNAGRYGEFLGERFARAHENIVWMMGGDDKDFFPEIWDALAEGIARGADVGDDDLLMTYHPVAGRNSTDAFADAPWLDFHTHQSGHKPVGENEPMWNNLVKSRATGKPFLDSEPSYEDHPIDFDAANGYIGEFDVRQAAYVPVFSGAAGHTYGHHNIWMMYGTELGGEGADPLDIDWTEALDAPGAAQMGHLADLMNAHPGPREPAQDIVRSDTGEGRGDAVLALRTESAVLVYTAAGRAIELDADGDAQWFDPRNGTYSPAESGSPFTPPSREDWVLVVGD